MSVVKHILSMERVPGTVPHNSLQVLKWRKVVA